jgi:hypothetical protein
LWYCHHVEFVNNCLYLLSVWTQLLEYYTFSCHLLYVLAFSGNHHAFFSMCVVVKSTWWWPKMAKTLINDIWMYNVLKLCLHVCARAHAHTHTLSLSLSLSLSLCSLYAHARVMTAVWNFRFLITNYNFNWHNKLYPIAIIIICIANEAKCVIHATVKTTQSFFK